VGNVDSFQGQERDIIAISLTRSNPQGEIGFLSDIRRMNVGMTRARRKLLLVGDSSTLCSHPFFGELLAYMKGVGGYRTAHEMGPHRTPPNSPCRYAQWWVTKRPQRCEMTGLGRCAGMFRQSARRGSYPG
jgi:superfamily I DNA and/or RNA helicase